MEEKKCSFCNQPITKTAKKTIYCSDKCRTSAFRMKGLAKSEAARNKKSAFNQELKALLSKFKIKI